MTEGEHAVELQDAITKAMSFARDALSQKLSIEEVEYQDAPPAWRITVGYKRPLPEKRRVIPLGGTLASMASRYNHEQNFVEYEDVYKIVTVPEDGGIPTIKIRKL